jgi:hypothetical protein
MAVKHTRLARDCQAFTGTTRAVYKTIADHASPGAHKNKGDKKKKHIPEDWTSIGYARMMMENYIVRVETLTNALKELIESGAIEVKTVNGRKWFKFNCEWAEKWQWQPDHVEFFRCKASLRYRTKKAKEAAEKAITTEAVVTKSSEITTESVVNANGSRCNDSELQREPLPITTENRTVVHPSESNSPFGKKVVQLTVDSTPALPAYPSNSFKDQKPNPGGMNPPVPPAIEDNKQNARLAPLFDDVDLSDSYCWHNVERKTCQRCAVVAETQSWAEGEDA